MTGGFGQSEYTPAVNVGQSMGAESSYLDRCIFQRLQRVLEAGMNRIILRYLVSLRISAHQEWKYRLIAVPLCCPERILITCQVKIYLAGQRRSHSLNTAYDKPVPVYPAGRYWYFAVSYKTCHFPCTTLGPRNFTPPSLILDIQVSKTFSIYSFISVSFLLYSHKHTHARNHTSTR